MYSVQNQAPRVHFLEQKIQFYLVVKDWIIKCRKTKLHFSNNLSCGKSKKQLQAPFVDDKNEENLHLLKYKNILISFKKLHFKYFVYPKKIWSGNSNLFSDRISIINWTNHCIRIRFRRGPVPFPDLQYLLWPMNQMFWLSTTSPPDWIFVLNDFFKRQYQKP